MIASTLLTRLSELSIGILWTGAIALPWGGVAVTFSPTMLIVGLLVGSLAVPLLKQVSYSCSRRRYRRYIEAEFIGVTWR